MIILQAAKKYIHYEEIFEAWQKKSLFAEQIERTSVYFFLHASISKVQLIRTYQDTIWMTLDGVKCNVHDVAYPSRGA